MGFIEFRWAHPRGRNPSSSLTAARVSRVPNCSRFHIQMGDWKTLNACGAGSSGEAHQRRVNYPLRSSNQTVPSQRCLRLETEVHKLDNGSIRPYTCSAYTKRAALASGLRCFRQVSGTHFRHEFKKLAFLLAPLLEPVAGPPVLEFGELLSSLDFRQVVVLGELAAGGADAMPRRVVIDDRQLRQLGGERVQPLLLAW